MRNNQSKEDYLKAVLTIRKQKGSCRSVDVAGHLNLTKASISRAVDRLSKEGLLQRNYDGQLYLTEAGQAYADGVEKRYELLYQFLLRLGLSEERADKDACSIEHCISDESYEKLLAWYQKTFE
ncbi:MAG: iron dependent repressor, metal binding and dimerization domain protein [Lachnospiraceae bacterium]|nr:iron dependent repressor, metal binding and dimerization domain protein [Lachnospiraceae bacterium]